MTVIGSLLAIAAQHGLKMQQIDVKTPSMISNLDGGTFVVLYLVLDLTTVFYAILKNL